jgi:hypothetical protein
MIMNGKTYWQVLLACRLLAKAADSTRNLRVPLLLYQDVECFLN